MVTHFVYRVKWRGFGFRLGIQERRTCLQIVTRICRSKSHKLCSEDTAGKVFILTSESHWFASDALRCYSKPAFQVLVDIKDLPKDDILAVTGRK